MIAQRLQRFITIVRDVNLHIEKEQPWPRPQSTNCCRNHRCLALAPNMAL
jgi:hypothetical protein